MAGSGWAWEARWLAVGSVLSLLEQALCSRYRQRKPTRSPVQSVFRYDWNNLLTQPARGVLRPPHSHTAKQVALCTSVKEGLTHSAPRSSPVALVHGFASGNRS